MRIIGLAARIAVAVLFVSVLSGQVPAHAAEIKVLSSNGVTVVMEKLGPQFEHATGNTLKIRFDVSNVLVADIAKGETFDVVILTGPTIDGEMKQGKVVAGSRVDIAKSGVGVAYKVGAPKPDIHDAESFKRTMLAAKSIAYTTQGASGQYFIGVAERLGIGDAVKAKSKVLQGGRVAELVAKGEAEFAVQQISELKPVQGVEVVPLPPELQSFTVFAGGIGADAKQPAAAQALIKFLAAPAALPVIKAAGMDPG
jgi:molybdate transport system substrate-binding protein